MDGWKLIEDDGDQLYFIDSIGVPGIERMSVEDEYRVYVNYLYGRFGLPEDEDAAICDEDRWEEANETARARHAEIIAKVKEFQRIRALELSAEAT